MDLVSAQVKDVAVFRRMQFAVAYLPEEMPNFWEIVTSFANKYYTDKSVVSLETTRVLMESLLFLDRKSFSMDMDLTKELITMEYGSDRQQLGIPLIPTQQQCQICSGKLLLKCDRPSRISLYTETYGTVPATHYHKYCNNYRKGCTFVQYYGFHKSQTEENTSYDSNWMDLPYFVSSQETAFEVSMLKHFDAELLLGQISYKQKADIYNVCNGYDTTRKECSSIEKPTSSNAVHG